MNGRKDLNHPGFAKGDRVETMAVGRRAVTGTVTASSCGWVPVFWDEPVDPDGRNVAVWRDDIRLVSGT